MNGAYIHQNLLRLSDEALELADRHYVDEHRLRHVVALTPEYHAEVVRQIIDLKLTVKQVKELCEGDLQEVGDDREAIPVPARKIARAAQITASALAQDIARAVMQQEGDATLARARIRVLQKLLAEAERWLGEA